MVSALHGVSLNAKTEPAQRPSGCFRHEVSVSDFGSLRSSLKRDFQHSDRLRVMELAQGVSTSKHQPIVPIPIASPLRLGKVAFQGLRDRPNSPSVPLKPPRRPGSRLSL
jgi:hypothetical protein